MRRRRRPRAGGHSFIELLVTTAVLAILASLVLPLSHVTRKRQKEMELRTALRDIRNALDMYHVTCRNSTGGGAPVGAGKSISQVQIRVEDDPDQTCWPKELDVLVEGVETNIPRYKLRYLRRIPRDPFNVSGDEHDAHGWRLVSSTDDPEGNGWNRRNVFDVRSESRSQALDGSYYKDW